MPGSQSAASNDYEEEAGPREFCANGLRIQTAEVEAKLDEGNIEEAESSLREGLSLNFEVKLLCLDLYQCFLSDLISLVRN